MLLQVSIDEYNRNGSVQKILKRIEGIDEERRNGRIQKEWKEIKGTEGDRRNAFEWNRRVVRL